MLKKENKMKSYLTMLITDKTKFIFGFIWNQKQYSR